MDISSDRVVSTDIDSGLSEDLLLSGFLKIKVTSYKRMNSDCVLQVQTDTLHSARTPIDMDGTLQTDFPKFGTNKNIKTIISPFVYL